MAASAAYEPSGPGKAKVIAPCRRANSRADHTSASPSGGTKSHHHVVRPDNRIQPRAEGGGKVESRQSAFAHDDRMNELYRDVLRIGRERAAAERQQAPALEETLRHALARKRQAAGLAFEEAFADSVTFQELVFDPGHEMF